MSPDTDFPSESADVSLWPQLIDFMHLCNKARTPSSVLEYMNGNRWCDVHPAVRDISDFLDAVSKLNESADKNSPSG